MSTTVPAGGGSEQDTSNQSEVDVLNEDSESDSSDDTVVSDETTGEETSKEEKEEESTTESKEEGEEEEEIVEEAGEELEELEPSEEPTRPSWQVIKEKYPELAKDKDFRELYFRDKAFTEVFPTVAEAKNAYIKAEQLDALDGVLVDGNVEEIFGNLNKEVLLKISDRILPSLYKVDKTAFSRAARPLIIDVMHNVLEQAERSGDDNLKKSVRNVSRALTGNPDLPSRVSTTADPLVEEERNRLRQEREGLFRSQERSFLNSADRGVLKKLELLVSDGLDPKGELNSFSKQAVIEKTLMDVRQRLLADEGLRSKLQHFHRLAAKSGFPDEYRARIVSASLERARKLIPVLRNKHRMAALGKQSPKGETKSNKIVTKNETVTTGGKSGGSTPSGKIDMKRTSAEDFLNDKIVYKK